MNIIDIINKKRKNEALQQDEIMYFVTEYTQKKSITDYQAAALLMAIVINGMNSDETYFLTKAMLESGKVRDYSKIPGIKIDKHSTGGIGDKVSIILAPICAYFGLKVAKMSGRGLGFTGGTIDKLESIGFDFNLKTGEDMQLLKKCGLFIMSQTADVAPADGVIYALRNSSGTVESIPLIASSVVSKKLALNADYIFLDVKVGDGAFMKNIGDATILAKTMIDIFTKFNKKTVVHITNMDQPLGRAIGNGLEIKAAIDFLNGSFECDEIKDLIYTFVSDILVATKIFKTKKEALSAIDECIKNKGAYKKFIEWVTSQKADIAAINSGKYFAPKYNYEIKANSSGYLSYKKTEEMGMISLLLGAGRLKKTDPLDYHAGIWLNKIQNESVKKNEVIATLYSSKPINLDVVSRFLTNVDIKPTKFKATPTILKVLSNIK
ncbi:MAG: thymidine phosphorylase [Mycoplasmataceae bacterium]|nr:thymidine phosphorylase [Mycoplasmataceae bacterium]